MKPLNITQDLPATSTLNHYTCTLVLFQTSSWFVCWWLMCVCRYVWYVTKVGGGVCKQDYVHIYSCHRQHMVCCDLHSNSFEQLSKRRYFQHVATPLGLLTHTHSLLTVFTVSDLTQEDNSTHYNRSFLRGEAKSSA